MVKEVAQLCTYAIGVTHTMWYVTCTVHTTGYTQTFNTIINMIYAK